ncbi:MAG: hypothetical protein R6W96_03225 [Clostridia bacterium]
MIVVSTPGRAGIIGNPTDGYGGAMMACSIRNRATVTLKKNKTLVLVNDFGKTELLWKNDFENKGDYFDVFRSVLRFLRAYDLKAEIRVKSNIPVQAGLSGSTAILSSLLYGILAFTGKSVNRYELAEMNRIIELHYLKCQCGYQDAYMTTFGGLLYLDFRGKEYYRELKDETYATVENLSAHVDELPFLVAHGGVMHNSGHFHKPLRQRWLEGEKQVVDGYREIAELARFGKKALLGKDWEQLGILMNRNHKIQDALAPSGEENNALIRTALENGAYGAKLAGAGGGGTVIILARDIAGMKDILSRKENLVFLELDPQARGVCIREDKSSQAGAQES